MVPIIKQANTNVESLYNLPEAIDVVSVESRMGALEVCFQARVKGEVIHHMNQRGKGGFPRELRNWDEALQRRRRGTAFFSPAILFSCVTVIANIFLAHELHQKFLSMDFKICIAI